METDRTKHSWVRRLGSAAVAAGVLVAVAGVAMPSASANHITGPVAICHATNSDSAPYNLQTPDASGVDGDGGGGDHYAHSSGPVWNPTLKALKLTWGDIIPPIPGHHAGMNWTDEGRAILAHGCVASAAAPSSSAVQCVGRVPAITVTLTNTGTADAVFVVQQDGANVGTADELTVTGLEDTETITLPQTEDVATVITVSSGAHSATYSFDSDCSTPVPVPAPVPGASAVECVGGVPGIVVTLTNAGDADAVFVVLQDLAAVGTLDELTVTDAEDSETITLTQVEDVATSISVTSGAFNTVFPFTSDCAPPAPGPGPRPVVSPVVVTAPAPPAPPVDACPERDGLQAETDECLLILPRPITPGTPDVPAAAPVAPSPATAVGDQALGRALPRTGSTTLPLLETGLGMILLGAGALLFGRERTART